MESPEAPPLSNAAIADRLASLAQLLSTQKENPYKVKAYQRAAARIRSRSESFDELVREDADLTQFGGIGEAIASAIREIVQTGGLKKLDTLRSQAAPEIADLTTYPRLDPKRVLRIYKKLKISTVEELRERLESGEIEAVLGQRLAMHVRQGLLQAHAILLYRADELHASIEDFLVEKCRVNAVQVAGAFRRRVEAIEELHYLVDTNDFPGVLKKFQRFGGSTPLVHASEDEGLFHLSIGVLLRIQRADRADWGRALLTATGSKAHLEKLPPIARSQEGTFESESAFYRSAGLDYIPPELREGYDEVTLAARHEIPELVTVPDIRGELHAHSTSSDGIHSIEQMAAAARARGYEYIGITDHSQSLKIARGVSIEDLWQQIRYIDELNERLEGIRVLKSSEVDILQDGSLDYPDDLLAALDYTVCSIHSRFGLNKEQQTERLLRAMDSRYFHILGHATGRLLLKRPGYEFDLERVVDHARDRKCFFEINSSPDRLDLSAENARLASRAGVMISVNTDAHSTPELALVAYGIGQARRAGLTKPGVLNCRTLGELQNLFKK